MLSIVKVHVRKGAVLDGKGLMMKSAQQFAHRVDADRLLVESAMESRQLPDGSVVRMAVFGPGPVVLCAPTLAELTFVYVPHTHHLRDRFTVVVYEPRISVQER